MCSRVSIRRAAERRHHPTADIVSNLSCVKWLKWSNVRPKGRHYEFDAMRCRNVERGLDDRDVSPWDTAEASNVRPEGRHYEFDAMRCRNVERGWLIQMSARGTRIHARSEVLQSGRRYSATRGREAERRIDAESVRTADLEGRHYDSTRSRCSSFSRRPADSMSACCLASASIRCSAERP